MPDKFIQNLGLSIHLRNLQGCTLQAKGDKAVLMDSLWDRDNFLLYNRTLWMLYGSFQVSCCVELEKPLAYQFYSCNKCIVLVELSQSGSVSGGDVVGLDPSSDRF